MANKNNPDLKMAEHPTSPKNSERKPRNEEEITEVPVVSDVIYFLPAHPEVLAA